MAATGREDGCRRRSEQAPMRRQRTGTGRAERQASLLSDSQGRAGQGSQGQTDRGMRCAQTRASAATPTRQRDSLQVRSTPGHMAVYATRDRRRPRLSLRTGDRHAAAIIRCCQPLRPIASRTLLTFHVSRCLGRRPMRSGLLHSRCRGPALAGVACRFCETVAGLEATPTASWLFLLRGAETRNHMSTSVRYVVHHPALHMSSSYRCTRFCSRYTNRREAKTWLCSTLHPYIPKRRGSRGPRAAFILVRYCTNVYASHRLHSPERHSFARPASPPRQLDLLRRSSFSPKTCRTAIEL